MFTVAEIKELMALIHAVVVWRNASDSPEAWEDACNALQNAAEGMSETTIEKLIAAINMKTMRVAE